MPEISRFYGIVIKMFNREHNPPHFHAYYGNYEAVFDIQTGQLLEGKFPPQKIPLVMAWALIHKKELKSNWDNLSRGVEIHKIDPLR